MDCRLKRNQKLNRCKALKRISSIPKIELNWKEAKLRFPKLSPTGNADKDKVINKKDCKPFNKLKHKDLYVSDRDYKAFELVSYGKEMGLSPAETHKELRSKGYTGDEMRRAVRQYQEGYNVMPLSNIDTSDIAQYS